MEKNNFTQYIGNDIFKGINFGLYNIENINFEETKKSVLDGFKEKYKTVIEKKLKKLGLELIEFKYFSPKAYNYTNDSIDMIVSIVDKKLLEQAIMIKKNIINKQLKNNKSYDGYIATTVDNVDSELEKINQENYEVDTIVLQELLDLNCSDFDIYNFFIIDDEDE